MPACSLDQPPKIDFPCAYPIKIMGQATEDFQVAMLEVLTACATPYEAQSVSVRPSRHGRFQSLRVTIQAQSEAHLQQLFEALKATGRVHLVL